MNHFEKKKKSRLFRPHSADHKTSYALQLAEKHFTALVIFQNSFLLGLKVYFWSLIFISYQLKVVNTYTVQRLKVLQRLVLVSAVEKLIHAANADTIYGLNNEKLKYLLVDRVCHLLFAPFCAITAEQGTMK
jgi:hypothetical protein